MSSRYPYYGEYTTGMVVYFVSDSTGTVVKGDEFHKVDEHCTDWAENVFKKIKFNEESNVEDLRKGNFIIGSQLKGGPKTVSISAKPKQHTNIIVANNEAERLAGLDTTKEFVVLEVKGIVSVPTPGPTWKK